jgi:hypothetical protein
MVSDDERILRLGFGDSLISSVSVLLETWNQFDESASAVICGQNLSQ